ncbi:bis(5'-adenosyl)-triphosphatase ENPP4 [Hyperolius riggenbachi]|uniref:bis(5'-adenosyl)-triphosphatase ENPP4 n=1 Tax=Hyperolius riggenbachi TaxID=752182 RepID=UPI0035A2E9D3
MRTLALLLTFGLALSAGEETNTSNAPKLLLVSFDGFRADYLLNYSMPNLTDFISGGVLVKEVKNIFITKTFPNHYTIVTGLYAESHGIVANSMYDPTTKKIFNLSDLASKMDPFWWNEATPIWVTNQRAGRQSGSAMWPGSDVKIQNNSLSNFLPYNSSVPFETRVDSIIGWFTKPKDPINFATLYFEQPDGRGHKYGPEDKENMTKVLKAVDEDIGYLMLKLKEAKLWDTVNVIITSDHGMAQCSPDRVIALDECIGRGNYTVVDISTIAAVVPLTEIAYLYHLLTNCSHHMNVYLKEEIPERYHYMNNARIQPLLLVADEGWTIVQNRSTPISLGNHGYDNLLPSMHPLLAAHGPAFQKNYKVNSINSVDIYPMMCHILKLKPEPNNGTLTSVKCMLSDQWCIQLPEAIGIVMGAIMVLTTLTCIVIMMRKKMPSTARPFTRLQFQEDDDPLIG